MMDYIGYCWKMKGLKGSGEGVGLTLALCTAAAAQRVITFTIDLCGRPSKEFLQTSAIIVDTSLPVLPPREKRMNVLKKKNKYLGSFSKLKFFLQHPF